MSKAKVYTHQDRPTHDNTMQCLRSDTFRCKRHATFSSNFDQIPQISHSDLSGYQICVPSVIRQRLLLCSKINSLSNRKVTHD